MPSKNSLKIYADDGIYHIYNRGIEKRDIFIDQQDYKTFLYFLKEYLLKENDPLRDNRSIKGRNFERRSFYGRIELLAHCLMPNHYHLLIKQKDSNDIIEFMKCLATSYSTYFNQKYKRVGTLFQGRYKAVLVENDEYLLHLSRYIHLNPVYRGLSSAREYDFSSYQDYLGIRNTRWVDTKFIISIFDKNKEDITVKQSHYQQFVEYIEFDSKEILGEFALD